MSGSRAAEVQLKRANSHARACDLIERLRNHSNTLPDSTAAIEAGDAVVFLDGTRDNRKGIAAIKQWYWALHHDADRVLPRLAHANETKRKIKTERQGI